MGETSTEVGWKEGTMKLVEHNIRHDTGMVPDGSRLSSVNRLGHYVWGRGRGRGGGRGRGRGNLEQSRYKAHFRLNGEILWGFASLQPHFLPAFSSTGFSK